MSKAVRVSVRLSLEKISPLIFVDPEVMLSLVFDKMLPALVRELLEVIDTSELENIRALVWLSIVAMLIVLWPKDLIEPEFSKLVEVKLESPVLWIFPEFVIELVVETVRLFPLKTSPELVKLLLVRPRFVVEESSPLFCKLLLRVKVRELVSEAIAEFKLLVRLLAEMFKVPLDKILPELVTSPKLVIVRLFSAEISPELVMESVPRIRF